MFHKNTITYATIFCVLFFTQCHTNNSQSAVTVEKFNHDSTLANNTAIRKADSMQNVTAKAEEERLKTVTSIKFEKEVYDFGVCNEGDKVKKIIEFTNTGKLPLVIEQAYGSCGCTVPTYDKAPVQPGQKGKLEVEFNSENKVGANTKSIMIQANTNPPITTVAFSIKVNPSKNKKSWF